MWRPLTSVALTLLVSLMNLSGMVHPNVGRKLEATHEIPQPSPTDKTSSDRVAKAYGKQSVSFESNAGQIDPRVEFFSRSSKQAFYLTSNEAVMVLPQRRESKTRAREVLRLKLQNANPQPKVTGLDELPGKTNYFIGADSDKWRTNVPSFAQVKYETVYPGIDVVYYSKEQEIEYDFIVAPRANYQNVRLTFDGARKLRIDKRGDLIIGMRDTEIRQLKPIIYQEIDGERVEIAGKYLLLGQRQVGFQIGAYDRSRTLVIDPVISYSTYLGGNGDDRATSVTTDSSGNSYITGYTTSSNFPVTRSQANLTDAFVVKLNPTGTGYVFKTYFGGSDDDYGSGVEVDAAGGVYVSGNTESTNFPRVNALQTTLKGFSDGFITKLNAAGNGMVYSTYLGGNSTDSIGSLAIDSAGIAYFVGTTFSTDLPVVGALQSTKGGGDDAFVGKLAATGNALVYLSYLGGAADEFGAEIKIDAAGNTYVVGTTGSTNFPTFNPLQQSNAGGDDGYVVKLNSTGSAFIFSTYLGGSGTDWAVGLDIDDSGIYLAGRTTSSNFPTRNPEQATLAGTEDGFITKLNPDASDFLYSTYLGGANSVHGASSGDSTQDIAVHDGNAYVIGTTDTTDFPHVNSFQPTFGGGGWDAYTAKYGPSGNLLYASYIGGNGTGSLGDGNDQGFAIAVDSSGNSYLVGTTAALDFPTVNALQPSFGGGSFQPVDGFAVKILDVPGFTISGQILDPGGNPISGVTVSLTGTRNVIAQTNASGNYSFAGLDTGYNCTVTPSKNLYSFNPPNQSFPNLSSSQTANFTGTGLNTYTISGRVTKTDGSGAGGVTINLTGSQSRSMLTDSSGNYAFSLLVQGESFTVTPSLPPSYLVNNAFTPGFLTFNTINANQTANFNLAITTTVSMYPVADAYVEDGTNAGVNFGSVTPMLVKLANQTGQRRDAYLKFDLSAVSRKITNAKLRIFAGLSAAGSVSTSAFKVTDTAWVESAINWNNKPTTTVITGATATVTSTTFATYDLDITSHLVAEQSAGHNVISIALHNTANSTPHILVNSREATTNKPQLVLTTTDSNNAVPTVSLTSPSNGASYTAAASVPLSASASDSDGSISKVDYYAGTNWIGTATVSPYSFTWPNVGVGSYTLTAVATDNQGATGVSIAVPITVSNGNVTPTVEIKAPLDNTTVPAGSNVTIEATANDVDGNVMQVEFFRGSTSLGIDTTAPYSISWTNAAAGAYAITARATDNSGAVIPSAVVNVKVVWQTGFSPVADAYVKDGSSAATNFGAALDLQIQKGATGSNRESYLRFDLTALTGTTGIVQARLRVYGRLSDASGTNVGLEVYSIASTTWGESGSGSITWNTKPVAGNTVLATTTVTDNVARWYELDVSSYVQTEKAAGRNLISLVLKSPVTSSPFITFNSRDATTYSGVGTTNRPQLLIWTTQTRNALFVAGSSNLSAADLVAKSRLESLGFTVTVKVANNQLVTADANGKALVMVSSTCTATSVGNKFKNVPVPVVNWEFDVLDDFAMTGTIAGTDFGTSASTQDLSITNASHAMAAGLPAGTTTVVSSASSFSWGLANVNAIKIASLTSDATKSVIFGYESGAAMQGFDAPARRVALFMTDLTASNFNSNGTALFDAAVRWATEVITAPTITLLTPGSGLVTTPVTITGLNFGQTQGTSTVTFNGVPASASNWGSTTIVVSVPLYATSGAVVVKVNGVSSNSVTFTVGEIDSDGDGLADSWELQYFGNLSQTAGGDPDGDGLTNLQEYQQGRNPTVNALSDDAGVNLRVFTPLASPTP